MTLILWVPMVVNAEPDEEVSLINIDSFVINSNEGADINATLTTSSNVVDTQINFDYVVSVVTDISQDGKEVASGWGTTGEDTNVNINMSNINTYDSYRFKITVTYNVDGQDYIEHAYSKIFDYTQESFSDDLGGRDITVDMTAKVLSIDWGDHMAWSAQSVLVIIDVDGEKAVEEIVYKDNKRNYDYYFDQDTKQITVTLKQIFDGKLSAGISDTIDIVKNADAQGFYVEFPSDIEQYNSVWTIKYYNGAASKLHWETDSDRKDLELNEDGAFLIEMKDDNTRLALNYTDDKNITWKYEFATDIAAYAPTISLLEKYDGSTVDSERLMLSGSLDDANATVKINDEEIKVDDKGMFSGEVSLTTGKNVVTIEATNSIGRTTKKLVTIYKKGATSLAQEASIFGEYTPMIITAVVSVALLAVMIIVIKMAGGKKNEEEA